MIIKILRDNDGYWEVWLYDYAYPINKLLLFRSGSKYEALKGAFHNLQEVSFKIIHEFEGD